MNQCLQTKKTLASLKEVLTISTQTSPIFPTLYIKSALYPEQVSHAVVLNPHMEIQLLGDFLTETASIEKSLTLVKAHQLDIRVLHSPLHNGDDVDLAQLEDDRVFDIAWKTCELGQALATYYKRRMPVVFHFAGDAEAFMAQHTRRQTFQDRLTILYHHFPAVDFYLENVIVMTFNKTQPQLPKSYCNAAPTTVPIMVRWLRETFDDPTRFYTVLDTCHALMTSRLVTLVGGTLSLDDYFAANHDVCGLIHLTNARGLGYDYDHGVPFTTIDIPLITQIFRLYDEWDYTCPLTLEINETDYTQYTNYRTTYQTIQQLLMSTGD